MRTLSLMLLNVTKCYIQSSTFERGSRACMSEICNLLPRTNSNTLHSGLLCCLQVRSIACCNYCMKGVHSAHYLSPCSPRSSWSNPHIFTSSHPSPQPLHPPLPQVGNTNPPTFPHENRITSHHITSHIPNHPSTTDLKHAIHI